MTQSYPIRLLTVLLLGLLTLPAYAATILVTSTADSGAGTLRQAVIDAADGDEITFSIVTDGNPIVIDEAIVIEKDIFVKGNGMFNTLIDGDGAGRIFTIRNSEVLLENMTIRNGRAAVGGGVVIRNNLSRVVIRGVSILNSTAIGAMSTQGGGGIYNEGFLAMSRVRVAGNQATGTSGSGGGIFNAPGGNLFMRNCTVEQNEANRAGGGIEDASGFLSEFNIRNTSILDNVVNNAPGNGGGIHVGGDGTLEVNQSRIAGNVAGAEGGGIWIATGELMIRATVVDNNEAQGDDADQGGGGLYNDGGTMRVDPGTRITNNTATGSRGSGGGILNAEGGRLIVRSTLIKNNTANRAGGGIEDASGFISDFSIRNSEVDSNTVFTSPGNGGGIHISGDGDARIIRSRFRGNVAGSEGGGLWNSLGRMTVRGSLIEGNTAAGDAADQGGGGIFNNGGTLAIDPGTRIVDNEATGAAGSGGGILNASSTGEGGSFFGALLINDSQVTGNTANRAGGGIEDVSGSFSRFFVINSEITNNTVFTSPGNGGGVHITGDGGLLIVRTLVSGNSAGAEGGGLWNDQGLMEIMGGTIADNEAMGDESDQGGGGVFNNGGTVEITRSAVIDNNRATGIQGSGGGILSTGDLTSSLNLNQVTVSNNTANRAGGGVELVNGTFLSRQSDYLSNTATGDGAAPGSGGAFHVTSTESNSDFFGGSVTGNVAFLQGGGLWNQNGATMDVERVVIADNAVLSLGGDVTERVAGGGIYNNGGDLNVTASSITGNVLQTTSGTVTVQTAGGGIANDEGGTMRLLRSTVAGNSAVAGGGIANAANGIIVNTTITSNTASIGGGINQEAAIFSSLAVDASLDITGSILADNEAPDDPNISVNGGTISSQGFNLVGSDPGSDFTAAAQPSDKTEVADAMLTMTTINGFVVYEPECNSAAVNAGNPDDDRDDQLGRDLVGTRDIGSIENQTACPTTSGRTAEGDLDNNAEGSNRMAKEMITAYPNPVRGSTMNVLLPGERMEGDVIIRVIDASGRIRQEVRPGTTDNYQLNLGDLKTGTYLLQVTDGAQVENLRFVVGN